MATASKAVRSYTKMVPQKYQFEEVTLKLSDKEASFLKFLLGYVGGSPKDSPRKFATNISNALVDAGVSSHMFDREMLRGAPMLLFKDTTEHNYGIFFLDNPHEDLTPDN
jgi:hypothetical protein